MAFELFRKKKPTLDRASDPRPVLNLDDEAVYKLLCKIDEGHQPTPEEDRALAEREALDLSRTRITALPESIGQLASLQILDLLGTPITALPESIGQLAKLQSLDLRGTRITALPESIGQLAKLQSLELSFTRITALPESIGQLAKLQSLDLSGTQIAALPESLRQLAKLQSLDLRNTRIAALPESLGQLAKLQSLDLSYTRITALPESIGKLASLQSLYLSSTPISALPESIGQLANLQYLYLRDTQITALPESIGQLANLQGLYLSRTPISALPPWIGALPALGRLDLSGLTLPAIPESLKDFRFVDEALLGTINRRCVNLRDVTLTEQDKSVFLEHPELIPGLYRTEDLRPVRECRVIFLGDGASGKSYTIRRFRSQGKKETEDAPYTTSETPGVEILDYPARREGEPFTLHFWDFGGQQLLHSMHRCFLSEDSCYVVTVKTRETKANQRARYWLRNVTAFAPKSPILLFVNCWEEDNGQRAIDEPGLREEYPMIQQVVYCSAKRAEEGEFREKLMEPILDMAAASPGCTKQVPRQWIAARDAIVTESGEHNYLTRERYHEICAREGISNEEAPELLSFFNSLGVCFSYHMDEHRRELEEYRLLSPVWLTNALYAVIEEGMAQAQDGRITEKAIRQMLCNPPPTELEGKAHRRTVPGIRYRPEECPWLLAVAEAHDLCYRTDAETLFFPALCGTNTPEEALEAPKHYPRHVSYLLRYRYLPDSVLHKLMIRCMRNSLDVGSRWLKGMVLKAWNLHRIVVRMDDEERLRIEVCSAETQPAYDLFWMLRREISEVNRRLNLSAEEFIVDGDDEFPLEAVLEAARDRAFIYGRSGKRDAEALLGKYYEKVVVQTMRVENKKIVISIPEREYHRHAKSDPALRWALYEAYKRICPYCGQNISNLRDMQVDHILPTNFKACPAFNPYLDYLSAGGFDLEQPDYIENYFPTHGYCNGDKSNRINEYSLPYWHDIAAQHASRVLKLMQRYQEQK